MGPEARSLRNCRRPVAAAPTVPQATLRPKLRSRRQRHEHTTSRRGAHSGLCRSTATIQKGTDCSVPAGMRHPPLTKKKSKTGLICSACSLSGAIHRGRYASYSFRPHGIVCEHRVAHCTAGQKSKVRNMTEGNPWRKVPSFFTKYRSRWCVKAGERFLPTVYQSS
eukprot:gene1066-636_t